MIENSNLDETETMHEEENYIYINTYTHIYRYM